MKNNSLYIHKNLPQMYQLDVDKFNTFMLEVSGNPSGIPIIFFMADLVVSPEVSIIVCLIHLF